MIDNTYRASVKKPHNFKLFSFVKYPNQQYMRITYFGVPKDKLAKDVDKFKFQIDNLANQNYITLRNEF